jgi:hypothetical protein
MASLGSNGPVWWDRECDSAGRPIRPDVRAAAHQIWDSAGRRVQSLLGDASEAPELMEKVVVQAPGTLIALVRASSRRTRLEFSCAPSAGPFDAMR